jgi:hypothetical protein
MLFMVLDGHPRGTNEPLAVAGAREMPAAEIRMAVAP